QQTQQLCVFLQANDFQGAYQLTESLQFGRYPTVRDEEAKVIAGQAKDLREQNKKEINDIKDNLFTLSPAAMKDIMQEAAPLVAELARVGQAFIDAYST
ncbi:hypothetical protein ACSFCD_12800, partial [Enterococcus faecalis]